MNVCMCVCKHIALICDAHTTTLTHTHTARSTDQQTHTRKNSNCMRPGSSPAAHSPFLALN